MTRHFIAIADHSTEELTSLLDLSARLKTLYKSGGRNPCLAGKNMIMIFEKPSSRTRLSFEVAMNQLGGSSIYIRPEDMGGPIGHREPIGDLMRVMNGYADLVVARTFSHNTVLEMAHYATMPVINALTDQEHPCQIMADILTIQETFGGYRDRTVAYIGDGNNVAMSLAMACKKLGLNFVIASPPDYAIPDDFVAQLDQVGRPEQFKALTDPAQAVRGAHIIYTDTWTSMGQEAEKDKRIRAFHGYQVNEALLELAGPQARVMHCLPAYRGLEITHEAIESPQSIVFQQAENRLHFQRALIQSLLTGKPRP